MSEVIDNNRFMIRGVECRLIVRNGLDVVIPVNYGDKERLLAIPKSDKQKEEAEFQEFKRWKSRKSGFSDKTSDY